MKNKIKFILGYLYSQYSTTKHRLWIFYYISKFCSKLMYKALIHDLSKYSWPEAKYFSEYIWELRGCTYGTEKYKNMLKKIQPCIDHHFKLNDHHPEFYFNNKNMEIIEFIEMICDFKAATKRHKDGDIYKSIEINQKRFNFDEYQMKIIKEIVKEIN